MKTPRCDLGHTRFCEFTVDILLFKNAESENMSKIRRYYVFIPFLKKNHSGCYNAMCRFPFTEDETFKEEISRRIEELRKEPDGVETPHDFLCPITHQLMRDPVIAAGAYY